MIRLGNILSMLFESLFALELCILACNAVLQFSGLLSIFVHVILSLLWYFHQSCILVQNDFFLDSSYLSAAIMVG